METIQGSVFLVRQAIPSGILLVAAAKTRSADEVNTAIDAGIGAVGYNYIQEAERMRPGVSDKVPWHLIGHLQRNKAKKAVQLFDMIETIDSVELAWEVNKHCSRAGKKMPVLIEINSGRESNKTGVLPENAEQLIREISTLSHVNVQGLMTMGPRFGNPEDARPYFQATRNVFDQIDKLKIPHVEMRYLSMGMSNSYRIAIEEGATIIRIGSFLFGERCRTGV
ncbi:MAG: YggS family pyridoxal phosphate-dependent enzyme [Mangrovibacterium sp.]|nr:YggS family pyridoxal phosphate-dependent enzyme [Mangrovibacterium sp.]